MELQRVRLDLEYDGTDFVGFQAQGKGERTVQQVLEATIRRLGGGESRIHGAGRTDAGVHALGQVVHFDVAWRIPEDKIATAINVNLPADLSVTKARYVESEFHARFSATGRTYRYAILNRPQPSAMLGRYVWHIAKPLDIAAMQAAAQRLIGLHDFASFGTAHAQGGSTVRSVTMLDVRRWKQCVLVTVRGNAFLRQMVRSFVGTLAAVGLERIDPDDVTRILESFDRGQCPPIAPARGLCLVRVNYDGTRLT